MPRGFGRPANADKRRLRAAVENIERGTGKRSQADRDMLVRRTDEDFERRLTGQNQALGKDYGEIERQMKPKFRKGGMVRSNRDYGK